MILGCGEEGCGEEMDSKWRSRSDCDKAFKSEARSLVTFKGWRNGTEVFAKVFLAILILRSSSTRANYPTCRSLEVLG